MHDLTNALSSVKPGDAEAAAQLLPLVYDELRKIAALKMAQEKPGQTVQATALVHEAYLRLVGGEPAPPAERPLPPLPQSLPPSPIDTFSGCPARNG
jgi:hypothetical protein